ncbi:TRAP transporter small permease [Hoeflea alexandrii]|uniref:TRAP transporter small permease n=1 Tax=Hoeflea alexandrii TaxID=288436 RepID=UPI0022AF50BD|nr:TRAP transporter small permease [Hoeflea alexandrii]MCZ4291727.1 TRAP transporter small permease [Hoeflea alexandrii]
MHKIVRDAKAMARAFALVGFTGLLLLALMTTLDVLLRWLFQTPIQGVNDVSSVVMAVVIAVCVPANLAMKQNIKVEVFGAIAGKRLNALLELFASLLTLVFIVAIAWQFVPYARGLYENGDKTWVLGWPIWPWWSLAAVMMWFAVLIQIVVLIGDFCNVVLGGNSEAPAHTLDQLL